MRKSICCHALCRIALTRNASEEREIEVKETVADSLLISNAPGLRLALLLLTHNKTTAIGVACLVFFPQTATFVRERQTR